jgi:hypothetical protein
MHQFQSPNSAAPVTPARPALDGLILVLLLVFPSTGFIQKFAGLAGVVVYVALVALVLLVTWRFGACVAPLMRRYYRGLSVLALGVLALCFALVYPMENGRGVGKSSDRDDGLNLAVTRMADGRSPYYPSDKSAGPLSVLPGAIVLSAPFVALGNSGYQNLFWLAVFLLAAGLTFRDQALALVMLTLPLAVSPAAQYEYISGGDMLANGLYVALFFLLALRLWSNPAAAEWLRWLACVLLGLGLASRPNFLLLLPLLVGVLWRAVGLWRAVLAGGLVAAVAVAITLPFYMSDPAGFTPLLARHKLAIIDHVMPWAGKAMIGVTAVLGILGAWFLSRSSAQDLTQPFFRWCTVVTLCPMVCAVVLFSLVNGHLDFGFMRDRFGLMYVYFGLFGWGGRLLNPALAPRIPGAEKAMS